MRKGTVKALALSALGLVTVGWAATADYNQTAWSLDSVTGNVCASTTSTSTCAKILGVVTSLGFFPHNGLAIPAGLYGMSPSNSAAANRTGLQSAINAGVAKLLLGPGTYEIDSTIRVDRDATEIEGQGRFATNLRTTSATADVFHFGTGSTFRKYFRLHDLSFTTSVTRTGGWAVTTNNTFVLSLQRVTIVGYCNGVDTYNAQGPELIDVYLDIGCAGTGKAITARGSGTGYNMYLTRVSAIGHPGAEPRAGLYVENFDGIFATDTQFNQIGIGIEFNPPAPASGQFPNFEHFLGKNLSLDSNAGSGMKFSNGGGYIFSVNCTQCYFDNNANSGIHVESGVSAGHVAGIHLDHPMIQSSGTHAVYLAGVANDVEVLGGTINGNGRAAGAWSGIQFGVNTYSNIQILGGRIGPGDNFGNTQAFAIGADGPGGGSTQLTNFQLGNVNMTGNRAPANSAFLTASFTNRKIANNLGLVTENSGTATVPAGSGSATVAHGLNFTPALSDLSVMPNVNSSGSFWWVDNVTSTTFRINMNSAPASNTPFSWNATIH